MAAPWVTGDLLPQTRPLTPGFRPGLCQTTSKAEAQRCSSLGALASLGMDKQRELREVGTQPALPLGMLNGLRASFRFLKCQTLQGIVVTMSPCWQLLYVLPELSGSTAMVWRMALIVGTATLSVPNQKKVSWVRKGKKKKTHEFLYFFCVRHCSSCLI